MARVRRNKANFNPALRMQGNAAVRTQPDPAGRNPQRPGEPHYRERVKPMVKQQDNVVEMPVVQAVAREGNMLPRMDVVERKQADQIIRDRYWSAEPQTRDIAEKMQSWERLYLGVWEDSTHDSEEHIFLGKTREHVQTVHAFLLQLVSQLPHLVTFRPKANNSLTGFKEEWHRAKVAEALLNFYLEDVWKVKTDVIPDFLKTFLKFSIGIIKISYNDDPYAPDLRFEVVDRALQYFPATAQRDVKDCSWWVEKDYWTRYEVEQMFRAGFWERPPEYRDGMPSIVRTGFDDKTLKRYMGQHYDSRQSVKEDDLVEVLHYYQADSRSLSDRYAVKVGGENGPLVRYGPQMQPYKGIPFRGKSFDPHEWQIDGTGLVSMYESIQRMLNTLVNMRLDDVRQNMWRPLATVGNFVDQTTIDDYEGRSKMIRLNDAAMQWLQNNQNGDLRKAFAELPFNTATQEIFQDMGFLMGQGQEMVHQSDAFRGQASNKVSTLGEIQELLSQNQGAFRPAFMQTMRLMEEVGEIALEYFKDPDFFGEERVMQIIGRGRYEDTVSGWEDMPDGSRVRGVSPDEMDVDVTVNAVNGADALLARTFRMTVVQQVLASVGQVEGLYPDVRDDIDFGALVRESIRSAFSDIESIEFSDEEKQQRKQARAQAAQSSAEQQIQLQAASERAKESARAEREVTVDQAKTQNRVAADSHLAAQESEQTIAEIVAKVSAEARKETQLALQEHQQTLERMFREYVLEVQARKDTGENVSVGSGSNRVEG